ncbi:MAG: hypothetical protein AAB897_00010 [Patescibacteria group bacterium]
MPSENADTLYRVNQKLDSEGRFGIADACPGERVKVHTEPSIYDFKVFDPKQLLVTIKSPHDPDFRDEWVCRFLGSVPNSEIDDWRMAPVKMVGCFLRDWHPVVIHHGNILVLPKVYQIEIRGLPFWRNKN